MIKVDVFFKFFQVFNFFGICRVWFFLQNYCQEKLLKQLVVFLRSLSFLRDKFVGMNIIGFLGFIKEREEICILIRVLFDFYVVMVVVRYIIKYNFLEFVSCLR